MIQIAICDKNVSDRAVIKQLVEKTALFKNAEYSEFDSGCALSDQLDCGRRYDIVFLTFKASESMERFHFENNGEPMIIFIAENPENVIQAFEYNAFHCILKNDSYEKVYDVLTKAYKKYVSSHKNYLLKCKEGPVCLQLSDIYYVEYFNKHLIFYTDKEQYTLRGTIGTVANDLLPFGFVQIHQGFVVNIKKIQRFLKNDVVLTNGMKVMMSSRKRNEAIAFYNKYIQNTCVK